MLRPFRLTLEIIASLLGMVVVLGLFIVWRLSTGPLHSSLLTPYLEAGIESIAPDTDASIGHTLLAWDDSDHSFTLHADDIEIRDRNGLVIAAVPSVDIQLSAIGIMVGQFFPTELKVDHPQFQLGRRKDGTFTFGGVPTPGSGKDADSQTASDDNETMQQSVARLADHFTKAFFTRKVEVTEAVFAVHDKSTSHDWRVTIPKISLKRVGRSLTGQASVAVSQRDKVSEIDVHYMYDRGGALHRLETHFSDITPAFFAGGSGALFNLGDITAINVPLSGDIDLALDHEMSVTSGSFTIHGSRGTIEDPTLFDKPRIVASFDAKGSYERQLDILDISDVAVDFGGPKLHLTATGAPPTGVTLTGSDAAPHKMDLAAAVELENWPMDQFGDLWPKPVMPPVRKWMVENLTKGTFDHADATFKASLDLDHLETTAFTSAKGKVSASGARVTYMDTLPAVDNVSTEASFDLDQITAQILTGSIGDIKVVPFPVTISGFQDDTQNISIPLKVIGPIPAVLKLIDYPPLGYTKALGLTPNDITGAVTGTVTFKFPLLQTLSMDDIGVTAAADLTQVASTKLVKGVDIKQGSLALNLNGEGFDVKGPAVLNELPLSVTFHQTFKPVSGKPLREANLQGLVPIENFKYIGVDSLEGSHGQVAVTLQITQPTRDKTFFTGSVDMTPADVHLDQLNWRKPPQAQTMLTFTADREKDGDTNVTQLEMRGPNLNIKGRATLSGNNGELTSAALNPFIAGRTNATLHYTHLEDGSNALHFDASGDALDITGFTGGKKPPDATATGEAPQPKEFRLKIGKLFTGPTSFVTQAEGYAIRDPKGWAEISLKGLADGSAKIDVELNVLQNGGRTLTATCEDFGKALKGLGLTDTVSGGALTVEGASDPDDPRAILGKASIGSFNVGGLPMLAVLMNAASPFGFAGLFSGSMDFNHVDGKFRWSGDTVKLMGVHAAGASVGLNVDGHVDIAANDANLRGTMVPFSVMNGVIGSIPVLGNLFTGGDHQGIFAVAYTITGPLDKPVIAVNPVSLLTPGFLRNLFFGAGEDDDEPSAPSKTND